MRSVVPFTDNELVHRLLFLQSDYITNPVTKAFKLKCIQVIALLHAVLNRFPILTQTPILPRISCCVNCYCLNNLCSSLVLLVLRGVYIVFDFVLTKEKVEPIMAFLHYEPSKQ